MQQQSLLKSCCASTIQRLESWLTGIIENDKSKIRQTWHEIPDCCFAFKTHLQGIYYQPLYLKWVRGDAWHIDADLDGLESGYYWYWWSWYSYLQLCWIWSKLIIIPLNNLWVQLTHDGVEWHLVEKACSIPHRSELRRKSMEHLTMISTIET